MVEHGLISRTTAISLYVAVHLVYKMYLRHAISRRGDSGFLARLKAEHIMYRQYLS